MIHKKGKGGNFPKYPHEVGRSGKKFLPGKYEDRGSSKSWVDKLPAPPKGGK